MKKHFLPVIFVLIPLVNLAQTLVFAELTGSPNVNTTNWNLSGASYAGDTGGDADIFSDEII
ncbi:MAG: hypothetical protein FJZ66_04760, partial [Bacteroidetes bacterium]|nr:hypothetical protein [Bacteroidota bacterium]